MAHRSNRWNRSWLVALFLLLGISGGYHFYRIRPVPLERDLEAVPVAIGNWSGKGVGLQSMPFRIPGAHEEIARIYRNPSGQSVILYIGYLEFQEQDRELANYLSRALLRGASKLEILTADGQSRPVNRTVFQAGQETYFGLFWYELGGGAVIGPYQVKLWTIWDGLARRQTNGAMVAVFIKLKQPSDLQRTLDQGVSFTRELIPSLQSYLPG